MVRTQGDTLTHVTVEAWDGEPGYGGQMIGAEFVPLIVRDSLETVAIPFAS